MRTATGFEAIIGQAHSIRLLKSFIRSGALPHALLFTGDDGIGKNMTAMAFAMALNCQTLKSTRDRQPQRDAIDSCGECTPCRKIAANHHPDIIRIVPHSTVIRIDQIRNLLQTLSLKPNEADWRLVILSQAQAMNPEAGNALLKVLEEPPDRTLLVLTARQSSDLLPTVVSRCRQLRFHPLPAADIEGLLKASGSVDASVAATAAALCGGSFTRAKNLVDPRWRSQRQWIQRAMAQVVGSGTADLRSWLMLSEKLAARKEHVEESLEIITMWLRDLLVVGCTPQLIYNRDQAAWLTTAAATLSQAAVVQQIEAVNGALAALRSNTNVRLTLDAMVLRMAAAGNG